ncbi:MAG: hypothetical protein KAR15_17970, partial [Desulfobacterales bacterium]|nr:hypothetical protein [Desulfobacterales bacterium]
PAKAGIQKYLKKLDFRFRGNDAQGRFKTFYETVKIGYQLFVIERIRKTVVSYLRLSTRVQNISNNQ